MTAIWFLARTATRCVYIIIHNALAGMKSPADIYFWRGFAFVKAFWQNGRRAKWRPNDGFVRRAVFVGKNWDVLAENVISARKLYGRLFFCEGQLCGKWPFSEADVNLMSIYNVSRIEYFDEIVLEVKILYFIYFLLLI